MAKQLFSPNIVCSDAFMTMPLGAQALYFQLSMEADNDGFVGRPQVVIRACGASKKEYKILIEKRFIIAFKSGVCAIKHYWINNTKRTDRYTQTTYAKEYACLRIKSNGAYSENDKQCSDLLFNNSLATNDIPSGNQLAATGCPNKELELKQELKELKPSCANAEAFCAFWSAYPKKRNKKDAEKAWNKLRPNPELQIQIMESVARAKQSADWQKDNGQFIPYPASWLRAGGWDDEIESDGSLPKKWIDIIATKNGEQIKTQGVDMSNGTYLVRWPDKTESIFSARYVEELS